MGASVRGKECVYACDLRNARDVLPVFLAELFGEMTRQGTGKQPRRPASSANSAYELFHRHRYPGAGLRDACDRRLSGE